MAPDDECKRNRFVSETSLRDLVVEIELHCSTMLCRNILPRKPPHKLLASESQSSQHDHT